MGKCIFGILLSQVTVRNAPLIGLMETNRECDRGAIKGAVKKCHGSFFNKSAQSEKETLLPFCFFFFSFF